MPKSIYSSEQELLQDLLRRIREERSLTQVELARQLDRPQSFVSKYESGERRLDVIELREVCLALGTTLPRFASRLEKVLRASKQA